MVKHLFEYLREVAELRNTPIPHLDKPKFWAGPSAGSRKLADTAVAYGTAP